MSMVMERRGVDAKTVKRLEVWEIDLGTKNGSVQSGHRPCVVISNNKGNLYSPVVIVIPLTSSKIKKPMPTHVHVDAESCDIYSDSTVLCEQIMTVPKQSLQYKLFELPMSYLKKINNAIGISLDLNIAT